MSDLQSEYDAAAKAETEAIEAYHVAERALWDAEDRLDRARERVQRAFVALANGSPGLALNR